MMAHKGSPIQPYEVIEKEETITRHFNHSPSNHPATFPNANQEHWHQQERNLYEQNDPKVVLKNCQFQALNEKFNKLRMVMSELTDKFKEINLKADNLPESEGADIRETAQLTSSNGNETKSPKKFTNECDSHSATSDGELRASFKSQTNQMQRQPPLPKQFFVDELTARFHKNKANFTIKHDDPKQTITPLLKQSKKILINLIDKELQRVQSNQERNCHEKSMASVPMSVDDSKQLKMKCIDRIDRELSVLKDLEGIFEL